MATNRITSDLWRTIVAAACVALTACGGEGDGGDGGGPQAFCEVPDNANGFGGYGSSSGEPCGTSNENDEAIGDGNLRTALSASAPEDCTRIIIGEGSPADAGAVYDAGQRPGALISRSAGVAPTAITITTYLNGIQVQSANGGTVEFEKVGGNTDADEYAYVVADQAFDSFRFEIWIDGPGAGKIFEICSDGGAL